MSITFKIKRGTNTQNDAYTGGAGELTMITTSNQEAVRFHDGATVGGFELARTDLKNVTLPLGGVTFEYFLQSGVVSADPGDGHVGFNIATYTTSTTGLKLHMDAKDRNNTVLNQFLDQISTVSSTVLGHFRIFEKSDSTKFKIFEIEGAAAIDVLPAGNPDGTAEYYEFDVQLLADSVSTAWANDEELVVSYQGGGDDGISIFLSKSTHSYTATSEGSVKTSELSEGAFTVNVYTGSTVATYLSSGTPVKNQFTVSVAASDITIDGGSAPTYTPTVFAKANNKLF